MAIAPDPRLLTGTFGIDPLDPDEPKERQGARHPNDVWYCDNLADAISSMIGDYSSTMTITEVESYEGEYNEVLNAMINGYAEQHADLEEEDQHVMKGHCRVLFQVAIADNAAGNIVPLGYIALNWTDTLKVKVQQADYVYATYLRPRNVQL